MDVIRHVIPFFIPIIAIVMGIGIGMLGLLLDYRKKSRMFELHHQERLLALERGMEVPPLPAEFFVNQRKAPASYRSSSLRWGLIWLLLGFALAIVLLLNEGPDAASWAFLPMALGAAQLIYFRMEKPDAE